MPQLVRLEVGVLGEPLLANVALVRFLPRVDFQMRLQVVGLRKTFGAKVAFKRAFARVRPQMSLQVAQLFARLGAKVAHVNSVCFLQWVRMLPDSAALAPRRRTARIDGR